MDPSADRDRRPHKILVIDDSEVVLARIKRGLLGEGYDVVTTTQMVGNARHLPTCDLVIIDYHMPGIDGQTVLQSLRTAASSSFAGCRFYLYTSDASLSVRFSELGFDGALSAKGDVESLVQQLRAVFRSLSIRQLRSRGTSPLGN